MFISKDKDLIVLAESSCTGTVVYAEDQGNVGYYKKDWNTFTDYLYWTPFDGSIKLSGRN
jgi:hypothetical protein